MEYTQNNKIGNILLELDLITNQQLEDAIKTQEKNGLPLNEIFISMNLVEENEILQAIEFKLGIPSVDIKNYKIEPEIIDKIPEDVARKHCVVPLAINNNYLTLAMCDPLNLIAIEDIKTIVNMNVQPVMAPSKSIQMVHEKIYSVRTAIDAVNTYKKNHADIKENSENDLETTLNNKSDSPVTKLVDSIIQQALSMKTSDIHIESFEDCLKIRFRIDGTLREIMKLDLDMKQSIVSKIKVMANLDITEKRKPQDGRIKYSINGNPFELRVSILPVISGEKVVIRVIDKTNIVLDIEKLGFLDEQIQTLKKMLLVPYGIILVCGPTGSGKTTTLYSILSKINDPGVNIISIEDPVEGVINGINQAQVITKTGLNFAEGLRSILRQDPDVIMIGEIRDFETAEISARAAITGHIVLSTIHTNDSVGAVIRLSDMGVQNFIIGSAVSGVIAQRLVRKICTNCKISYKPEPMDYKTLEIDQHESINLHKGAGCDDCGGSGYSGRIAVFELLEITRKHKEMIANSISESELRDFSIRNGMKSLSESAKKYVLAGDTTIEEYLKVAYSV